MQKPMPPEYVIMICIGVLLTMTAIGYALDRSPAPIWNASGQPTCPNGWQVYVDEQEALAGKPFVHCVR